MREREPFGQKGRVDKATKEAQLPRQRKERAIHTAPAKAPNILRKDIGPSSLFGVLKRLLRID